MNINKVYKNVTTPFGDQVGIELVGRKESEMLIQQELDLILGEFRIAFQKKNIYQLIDGSVLLDYTLNAYMIRLDNYDLAKKLLYNEFYGILILHKSENKYYYYFSLPPKHFIEFAYTNDVMKLDEVDPKYYINYKGENKSYKVIEHKGGIVYYFERAEGICQGTWYPDLRNFKYFYNLDASFSTK